MHLIAAASTGAAPSRNLRLSIALILLIWAAEYPQSQAGSTLSRSVTSRNRRPPDPSSIERHLLIVEPANSIRSVTSRGGDVGQRKITKAEIGPSGMNREERKKSYNEDPHSPRPVDAARNGAEPYYVEPSNHQSVPGRPAQQHPESRPQSESIGGDTRRTSEPGIHPADPHQSQHSPPPSPTSSEKAQIIQRWIDTDPRKLKLSRYSPSPGAPKSAPPRARLKKVKAACKSAISCFSGPSGPYSEADSSARSSSPSRQSREWRFQHPVTGDQQLPAPGDQSRTFTRGSAVYDRNGTLVEDPSWGLSREGIRQELMFKPGKTVSKQYLEDRRQASGSVTSEGTEGTFFSAGPRTLEEMRRVVGPDSRAKDNRSV